MSEENVTVVVQHPQMPTYFVLYFVQMQESSDHLIHSIHYLLFDPVENGYNLINLSIIYPKITLQFYNSTHITGNTFGNTTEPSAKYWYKTLVSSSDVEYFTSVASTVKTRACVDGSDNTSGSNKTFDSLETDERDPRS